MFDDRGSDNELEPGEVISISISMHAPEKDGGLHKEAPASPDTSGRQIVKFADDLSAPSPVNGKDTSTIVELRATAPSSERVLSARARPWQSAAEPDHSNSAEQGSLMALIFFLTCS